MRSDIWIIHRLKPSACLICCPRVFKRFRDRYNCGGRARSTHFANVQKLLPTTGRVEHARPLQRASSRNRLRTDKCLTSPLPERSYNEHHPETGYAPVARSEIRFKYTRGIVSRVGAFHALRNPRKISG